MNAATESLYESAPKIQARSVWGRFAKLRVAAMVLTLGLFYLTPWITVDGEPLVFFDLAARRFHLFTLTFVPQDVLFLSWLIVLMALTLFLVTSLAGRVFCGYACPQTVWTEAFMWIERAVEGDAHRRKKLDALPWHNRQKLLKRGTRHFLWIVLALFTGLTFVSYFIPARELFPAAARFDLHGWAAFWALFYAFATWGNAGFMREQVCKYMCPYARFQSAMFDKDTLLVAYDEKRGEPRKSLAKQAGSTAGDCIDCSMCVQVCPTGIDIRKGLQYECIACAACIDACDDVMAKVGKAPNLIRYSSEHRDMGGQTRVLRPRTVGYFVVWAVLGLSFLLAVWARADVTFDVIKDRRQLYRTVSAEQVENVYRLKVTNKTDTPRSLTVTAQGADGDYVVMPDQFPVAAGATESLAIGVRGPASGMAVRDIRLQLIDQAGEPLASRESVFITPGDAR